MHQYARERYSCSAAPDTVEYREHGGFDRRRKSGFFLAAECG